MRNSQRPVQTSSFHTWPPQLFQHGIRPQPGIPIQRSSISPFLGTNLSFLLTWGRSNYPPAQIWGGDPEIKVLHFQPGLLTQLPRLPYLQRHQRLWRDWGAEGFLDPPPPLSGFQFAKSPPSLLFQFPNFFCSFATPIVSIFVGFRLFKKTFYGHFSRIFKKSKINCVCSVHYIYLEVSICLSPLNVRPHAS